MRVTAKVLILSIMVGFCSLSEGIASPTGPGLTEADLSKNAQLVIEGKIESCDKYSSLSMYSNDAPIWLLRVAVGTIRKKSKELDDIQTDESVYVLVVRTNAKSVGNGEDIPDIFTLFGVTQISNPKDAVGKEGVFYLSKLINDSGRRSNFGTTRPGPLGALFAGPIVWKRGIAP